MLMYTQVCFERLESLTVLISGHIIFYFREATGGERPSLDVKDQSFMAPITVCLYTLIHTQPRLDVER